MAAPINVSSLALGNWKGGVIVGHRRIVDRLYIAEIPLAGALSFALKNPSASGIDRLSTASGLLSADSVTIDHSETGDFQVLGYAFKIPASTDFGSSLVATNGNRLKLASAVTITTANGAAASAVAASTTFAQAAVDNVGASNTAATEFALKTGDVTLTLYSENGSNAAGSAINASAASIYIPIVVTVAFHDVNLAPETDAMFGAYLREIEE